MLQSIIAAVIITTLGLAIKVQETFNSKEFKECDETDWNEYYAHK